MQKTDCCLSLLLTHKALNGLTPSYIRDLLRYKNSGRVLRSSSDWLLDDPVAKLKAYGDRAYSVSRTETVE